MNLLISKTEGLSPNTLINHVDQGLTSHGNDRGFKSQGSEHNKTGLVRDPRHK
jgi:hypothetical protein